MGTLEVLLPGPNKHSNTLPPVKLEMVLQEFWRQIKTLPSLSFTKLHWQGYRVSFKLGEEQPKRSQFFRQQIFGVGAWLLLGNALIRTLPWNNCLCSQFILVKKLCLVYFSTLSDLAKVGWAVQT